MRFHLYLPQVRFTYDELLSRALAAEANGFEGLSMMDHLEASFAPGQPVYDAIVTATWLAAQTTTLRFGHLVLCDALRQPAVLAKEAVSLDHASGGRFELGIGWGSVPEELVAFGVGPPAAKPRVDRLAETLQVLRALWSGEEVNFHGTYHVLSGASQAPLPLDKIPVIVGGAGRRTLQLVGEFADWWNLPVANLDQLDALRPHAKGARVSVQAFVTLVTDPARRAEIDDRARRRFGPILETSGLSGTPDELVESIRDLEHRGVERLYAWFTDFAPPETLATFGSEVIAAFS
jgi:alkanesulfonate monooxygenase SsuD/methylene tetrahydromethanopterin reductase-like flavin-dependent oxidoreductase (luciferase family)